MADDEKKREDVPEFYANGLQFALSPFDAMLVFGMQDLPAPDPNNAVMVGAKATFRPVARVRISPQLAVIVSRVLARALEDYEKQHGKIPVPSEVLKQLGLTA